MVRICDTTKSRSYQILVTFDLKVCIQELLSYFLDKETAHNLKASGHILMKCYTIMYHSWFYKSNKSEHI